ncbi:DUF4401 domain-containing protein [Shewanella ulleungensis]|uniref:DUF4401 domain-containing protein n=1 Tax=Shewanella ulleungensis TaxID=2282699 RepID=A0ABQ2QHI6_9GAMM|nr:DUF4401 domain-containing protein [Shewanella ulleungensis]MCL1149430.1 DUF4401 domain-containing protein [Shewanella ulleungensis]GGP79069.1 hypothetical protein GCM10009410_09310 [Shewanella ulleungensis]
MSNIKSYRELWQTLLNKDLVNSDTAPESLLASPWYMIAAQMLGGWVASLFLLGFVMLFVSSTSDITESFIGFGGLLTLGCLAYYRLGQNRQEFILQMIFAFSLCGQIMLLFGTFESLESSNDTLIAVIFFITFAIHWIAIPHKANQFIAALAMIPSLLAILVINHLSLLILPLLVLSLVIIWTQLYRWPQHYQRIRMLGYAVAVSLLLVNFMLSEVSDTMELPNVLMALSSSLSDYLAIVISLLSALWLINQIYNQLHSASNADSNQVIKVRPRNKLMVILAAILIGLLSLVMSGLSAALLMLLLGYFYNERKLVVISVCALLAFIGMYYYSLHIDLFDKSLWLMTSGIMLLLLRFAMGMNTNKTAKTEITINIATTAHQKEQP